MRSTNNEGNNNPKHPDDDVYYVVYDNGTGEYLTDWDVDEDSREVEFQQWQEIDFEDNEAVLGNIRKFDTSVMTYSRKNADRLLLEVAANLCERFPDEQIELVVHKITVQIHRSAIVEESGQVQSFGYDEEQEDEDLTPEPRSWTVSRDDDDDEEQEEDEEEDDDRSSPPLPAWTIRSDKKSKVVKKTSRPDKKSKKRSRR